MYAWFQIFCSLCFVTGMIFLILGYANDGIQGKALKQYGISMAASPRKNDHICGRGQHTSYHTFWILFLFQNWSASYSLAVHQAQVEKRRREKQHITK